MVLVHRPGHRLEQRSLVFGADCEAASGFGWSSGILTIFLAHPACGFARTAQAALPRLLDGDSRPIGEHFEGFAELDPFHFHHEAEDVAADVAHPTLERLPLGIDLKAGAGVVVPGTEADVVAALATQLDVAADQIDDVDRLLDPLFAVERATSHR